MNGALVLIDEDVAARAWAAKVLETNTARFIGFSAAQDFFAMVSLPGPACILVDGKVKDMTCAQVQAECLRRRLRAPRLFFVDTHQVDLAVSLMKAGATDVLSKPLDVDELRRRVHTVLSTSVRVDAQAQLARERLDRLTQRELEVVMLATTGLSNKDIAERLHISFRTVEVHRRNALRKTGSANVVELTHFVSTAWRDADEHHRAEVPGARDADALRMVTLDGFGVRLPSTGERALDSRGISPLVQAPAGADQRNSAPSDTQLTLWSTGEPVRAVQRSGNRR